MYFEFDGICMYFNQSCIRCHIEVRAYIGNNSMIAPCVSNNVLDLFRRGMDDGSATISLTAHAVKIIFTDFPCDLGDNLSRERVPFVDYDTIHFGTL